VKVKKLAQMIAMIGVAGAAAAQTAPADQSMARVEITGSSIKRIAKEGALPIQTITFEDIRKLGVTSAEQLLTTISANGTGADNAVSGNNVFGADADRVSGGASFASLRGLGPNSTLVLVNGRRIATHGASGKAVDLNAIPVAAIQRVEVLKDGASAIYGTDAVGGVVNFILKSDYKGLEATINDNFTERGGGATRRASLLGGFGDYATDGFNVMASVTVDHNDSLTGKQRHFNNGYQPDRGLSPDTTGAPYANILSGTGTALGSGFTVAGDPSKLLYTQASRLSLTGKCDTIPGMMQYNSALWAHVTNPKGSTYSCAYDYGADYMMSVPQERTNFLSRGTFRLSADHKLIVEAMASRSDAVAQFTPVQLSATLANKAAYPVGGPYYEDLSSLISTFDKTKPIAYKWRTSVMGDRTQRNVTDNGRLLAALEGTLAGKWDYKLGASANHSSTDTSLIDGYFYTDKMYALLGTGIVNPWLQPGQTQTQAAMDALNAIKFHGGLQKGATHLVQVDGTISGELMDLPAGALAGAVGFDYRKERYAFTQYTDPSNILLAPGNANLKEASRDIKALYTELIAPITKQLEIQFALRTDDYSLVGRTTNPKVAFRYQPTPWLLFRGSANKGFLAPSFNQLYSGSLDQELPNGADDPVNCPSHPNDPRYCAIPRVKYYSGGNAHLRPETSKQGSLGFVIEPIPGYSASLDYWAINTKDQILNRTPQIVLANYQALAANILRNPDGTIDHIQAGWINAGGSRARGADVSLKGAGNLASGYKWAFALDGTYMNSFMFQEIPGQAYKEYVGKFFTRDLYLRWKHFASLTVSRGDWSAVLSQRYADGYDDELPDAGKSTPPAGFNPQVHSYTTYGLSGTYKGYKNTSVTVGVANLLDTNPPFTAHNVDEVVGAGWDPRVADPRGRAVWFNVTYKFF
jgi:iron complex outermembrane receptor protein